MPVLTLLRATGGCTFAEDPARDAPRARIIWRAALDPGALEVDAAPTAPNDPNRFDPARLAPFLSIARDATGREYAVLSDGRRRIRLDVVTGSLQEGAVVLSYRLAGVHAATARVLTLRRLLALCVHARFSPSLFPPDPRIARWIEALRVHDALEAGASQREIASTLWPDLAWRDGEGGDAQRSRLRRLVLEARVLAAGGYRELLRARR